MSHERTLYDDFVMDHIRNARNFRMLPDADLESTGVNPLCGDTVTLQLRVAGDRIEEAAFQCECCGISMASTSMMTDWVRGREIAEASALARLFSECLEGKSVSTGGPSGDMERALLATVRDFPARKRCAALPWVTLVDALGQK